MDIYNLINSKTIAKYCEEQKYEFNTLEVAVLIYRNRSMSIEDKIKAYKEVIDTYEDMEVTQFYDLSSYDSVKEVIKTEIKRLEDLYKKLLEKEEGCFYTATTYWQETGRVEKDNFYFIKDTFEKTYNRVMEDVNYVDEDDSALEFFGTHIRIKDNVEEFRINKRAFDSEYVISADYIVIDRKPILFNILDSENDWPDLGLVYVYMPTPFKKGDILYSRTNSPFDRGYIAKGENVFVLDTMHSWKYPMPEKARAGKAGDGSDMMGYGYFIMDNDLFTEVCWEYDSWEYFEGELKGIQRILKPTSELLKGEIDISLFIQAYNKFRLDIIPKVLPDTLHWFTNEGLKMVGLTDEEIKRIKE